MSKEFYLQIAKQPVVLTPDNCGIALFRNEPDKDYLDYYRPTEDGEAHTWCFGRHELFIWMGGVALTQEDQKMLRKANREHGTFREQAGFNPTVVVEDETNQLEEDLWMEWMTSDLTKAIGIEDIPE